MRVVLKKVSLIIIASVMLINVGCSKKNDIEESSNIIEAQEENITFEEAIETSDCAVNEDGKILVTFLKGSVELGGKYVVMLNKVGEESIIYSQSSKNSVISVDDKKLLNDISSYIQE